MKVDPLEAHDRYQHLLKQEFDIGACCQNLIDQKPFGNHAFYIFAHTRTDDDGLRKRLIWSPWIWKPRAQTNSMLFKAYPGTDVIKVIWMIPMRELWPQFSWDKMMNNELVINSIYEFNHDREKLEAPEPDDPTPEEAQDIALEYQPQLFIRDLLPDNKKAIWDTKMRERDVWRKERDLKISAELQR